MKKGWNNPFFIDPAAKFGLSPDPGILKALGGEQRNRNGAGRASGNSHGVTYGRPRPVRPATRTMGHDTAGTLSAAEGTAIIAPVAPDALSGAESLIQGTTSAGSTGSAGYVQAGSGRKDPLSAGKPGYGAGAVGKQAQTGPGAAYGTAREKQGGKPGRIQDKTASLHADGLGLLFSEDDLLRGFIMAEVLGRPKCLRRGGGMI